MKPSRGFTLLLAASTTSALGNGVRWIALPLLAVQLSTDPGTVTLITAAEQAPWLLFGLFAGVLADRYDRRRLTRWADLARALLAAGFTALVATHGITLVAIGIFAFLLTCGEAVTEAAVGGLIPALVPPGQLAGANGRLQAGALITDTLIGSSAGALLFTLDPTVPFAVDTATFLAAAALISLVPGRPAGPVTPRPIRADLAAGLRFLAGDPLQRLLAGLSAVNMIVFAGITAVLVLYATQALHLSPTGYGLLIAAFAVGGIGGGLSAGRLGPRLGTRISLVAATAAFALCTGTLALTSNALIAGAAIAVFGAATAVSGAVTAALRQSAVPDALLGRVTSAFKLVTFGAAPAGAIAAGAVAGHYGLRAPFLAATAITLVTTAVTALRLRPALTDPANRPDLAASRA
jgi:MFS family permease